MLEGISPNKQETHICRFLCHDRTATLYIVYQHLQECPRKFIRCSVTMVFDCRMPAINQVFAKSPKHKASTDKAFSSTWPRFQVAL